MVKMEELNREADAIRDAVFSMNEDKRREYYDKEGRVLADPDTYAVLNYFFFIGIHHLYLRRFTAFFVDMLVLIAALVTLHNSEGGTGLVCGSLMIAFITIKGVYELMMSQKIVTQHNNNKAKAILSDFNIKMPGLG